MDRIHSLRSLMEGSVLGLKAALEEFKISHRGYYMKTPEERIYNYNPASEVPIT